MKYSSSWISSSSATFVLIAFFFLPWLTVSCSGVSVSPNGYELASGNIPAPDGSTSRSSDEDVDNYEILWLVPVAAAIAIYGVYVREKDPNAGITSVRNIYASACGSLSLALIIFYSQIRTEAIEARSMGAEVTYEIGLWVAVLSAIGLGIAMYTSDTEDNAAAQADNENAP